MCKDPVAWQAICLNIDGIHNDQIAMPKLIVKPTINFLSTDSDIDLGSRVGGIIYSMAGNESYPEPVPTLAMIKEKNEAFMQAVNDAADGGKLLTLAKNTLRAELATLVRSLANYVTQACGGDYVVLVSSGFPTHKPQREKIGILSAPATPTLKHGILSGTIKAMTKPQRGVFIYNWQVVPRSAPEKAKTVQSTSSRVVIEQLEAGQLYEVSVSAMGAAGPSAYSQPNLLMAV